MRKKLEIERLENLEKGEQPLIEETAEKTEGSGVEAQKSGVSL